MQVGQGQQAAGANPFLNTGQVDNGANGISKAGDAGKSQPPGGAATFAKNDVGAAEANDKLGKLNQGQENPEGKGLNLQA